jgi:hypothetical protein
MRDSRPGSGPYHPSSDSRPREAASGDPVEALILDLLHWIGPDSRPYAEVMGAWRTSCPRLPVWEEANERGFIARRSEPGRGARIALTALGREHLARHREAPSPGYLAGDPHPVTLDQTPSTRELLPRTR